MTTPETIPTQNNLPDLDRLSVLTAVVFLAYVTQRLFVLPVWRTELVLLGSEFAFQVDTQLVIGVLLAGLMLTGANWLFHDHPEIANQILLAHLLLPVLAASMLSVMLGQLPFNALWWVSLLAGIVLVVFVLVAEYISIGKNDRRQPFAVAVLTAVEFMLFFAAITILRGSEVRLYQLLPLVFLAAGGVSLRNHHLRLQGDWLIYESLLIAFLVSQFATVLHYWPLSPLAFGLLLLGAAFGLNSFFVSLIEEKPVSQAVVEPLVALALAVLGAWLFA